MFGMLKSFFGSDELVPPRIVMKPVMSNYTPVQQAAITNISFARATEAGRNLQWGWERAWQILNFNAGLPNTGQYTFVTGIINAVRGWHIGHNNYQKYLDDLQAYQQAKATQETDADIAMKKEIAELKTANELAIQQANIERAKWQSEKEKLESAILEAKLAREQALKRQAEEHEKSLALEQAKLSAKKEDEAAKKKKLRNFALVAATAAIASQVI